MDIIAVEGLDCTGKSTVCPLLAQRLNASVYRTPPETFRNQVATVDRESSDEEHYRFFLRGIQWASAELSVLRRTTPVVLDRYWMTTVAYHKAMGINAKLEDFGDIVLPDLTIYLTVRPDVQARRFKKRGVTSGDRRTLALLPHVSEAYKEIFRDVPVIRIDTSDLDPDSVVQAIENKMLLIHQ